MRLWFVEKRKVLIRKLILLVQRAPRHLLLTALLARVICAQWADDVLSRAAVATHTASVVARWNGVTSILNATSEDQAKLTISTWARQFDVPARSDTMTHGYSTRWLC